MGPLGLLATAGPKILNAVGSALKAIVDVAVKAVLGILSGIENWLVKKLPKAAGFIHGVFAVLKGSVKVIGFILKRAVEGLVIVLGLLGKALGGLVSVIGSVFGFFYDVVATVVTGLKDGILWVVNAIGTVLSWVYDNVIKPVWEAFKLQVEMTGKVLGWLYDHSIGAVISGVKAIGDKIAALKGVVGGTLSAVGGFFADIGGAVGGFFSDIGGGISSLFGGGGKSMGPLFARTTQQLNDAMKKAQEAATALPGAAAPEFKKYTQAGVQAADAVRQAYQTAIPKNLGDADLEKQLKKFRELQKRVDATTDLAKLESSDLLKNFNKQAAAIEAATGHAGQFYLSLEALQRDYFVADKKQFGEQNQSFVSGYQKRLDTIFDVVVAEAKSLDTMRQTGQITQKDYESRMQATFDKASAQRTAIEAAMKMTAEQMTSLIAASSTSAAQLAAVAMVTADKHIADLRQKMTVLPGEMESMQQKTIAALQQSYLAELNYVFTLPSQERVAALASVESRYAEMNAKIIEESKRFSTLAMQDAALATSTAQVFFDQLTDGMSKKTEQMTGAATAAIGTMQHELGIGNEEALRSLEAVATIDPKKFESNLKKIKKSFVDFTKEIAESFKTAWDSALKSTAKAMEAIDADLNTTISRLRGLAAALDVKSDADVQARQAARAKDIRAMAESERDQELLNATNWPLWYDDYRTQFSMLIAAVHSTAGGGRGGRTSSASQGLLDKAPNGASRGTRG
jgi:hypothetical protein